MMATSTRIVIDCDHLDRRPNRYVAPKGVDAAEATRLAADTEGWSQTLEGDLCPRHTRGRP